METGKTSLRMGWACIALLAVPANGIAQPAGGGAVVVTSQGDARETNRAMLDALLKRRSAVVQSPGGADSKRAALAFLDRQIAKVRSDLAN